MTHSALPPAPPDTDAVLPGRIAELLADRGESGLAEALDLLVTDLALRSAVLREADLEGCDGSAPVRGVGRLRAVAGDAVHAVPAMRVVSTNGSAATVDLCVRAAGRDAGVLSIVGARPSQLPALRAVAAVIGLALSRPARPSTVDAVAAVVAAADAEADAAADLIHDGPVQALVVAHYAAEAAVRGGDPAAAREAVRGALVELRRSLWHLRPRSESGLAGSLGMLSARLEEAGRPPLGFVLDEPLAAALPPAVVSTVYRLVQAVALPAAAEPVRVLLRREGATAVLDITGGAALSDVERWAAKAWALSGSVSTTDTGVRLALPLTASVTASLPAPMTRPRPKATS